MLQQYILRCMYMFYAARLKCAMKFIRFSKRPVGGMNIHNIFNTLHLRM